MKKSQALCFLVFFCVVNAIAQNSVSDQSIQNDFQNYTRTEGARNYSGSFLPVFSNKENTVGNRYLFAKWVPGQVVNLQNTVVSTDSFLFNYDKMGGVLLATKDKQTVIEVNDAAIKSFTLINEEDTITFERIPAINDHNFLIGLVENKDRYSLYKSLKTRFEKSNFTTNGIFESGKKYDEFVDEYEYYIVFPGKKEFKKVALKRKSVKEALAKENKKVKEYFSKDEQGIVNESFLTGLIIYLNQ